MANNAKRFGACLCGAVRISTDLAHADLGACHCSRCLKWAGGPVMELECGKNVVFQGDDNIQVYESSKWAERGFCKVCGSHLFIRDKNTDGFGIPVGLFENRSGISFNRQVFIDNKPSYYSFSDSTTNIISDYIHEHYPETQEK